MAIYHLDSSFSPEEWSNYLQVNNSATVYHTLEWRSVLEEVFRYKTHYLVCRDDRGNVVGVIPLAFVKSWITGSRVVSLPLSQYGGPLTTDEGALATVLEYLRGYLEKGFEYVRMRNRDALNEDAVASFCLKTSDYFSRCFIPLAHRSLDDVWKSMDKGSVRWAINQSRKHGIIVDSCNDMNDVNRIRDLMYQTCKRHGTPAYPAQLLNAIMNRLAANNFAKVFVARLQEKIVAALVLFTMSKEGIYAYNFSDEKYLDSYPNNALLWAAIKWSMDNELRLFDMGISSPHDKELFAFKMRWGATAAKLHDYFIGANEQLVSAPDRRSSRKYASATTIWKLIPGLLANRLGPRLIRHLE